MEPHLRARAPLVADRRPEAAEPPPSEDGHLRAVERLMARLCSGERLDRAGIMANEHLVTGGRRVRARLALTAARALGVPSGAAIPWAAAVELLHNATLIHDDIQDGDQVRRGRPTTWVRHGVNQAINAGDLMLMLPWLAVAEAQVAEAVRYRLCLALADRAQRTVRGQVDELDLLGGRRLDERTYTRVIHAKTAHLLALPVEGAALLADLDPEQARTLAAPFEDLGVIYQLIDDCVDLWGDKGREAPGADLREGKVSALVVAHLELHPEDRDWLLQLLNAERDATPDREISEAIRRFREGGALARTLERVDALAARVSDAPELTETPELQALARGCLAMVLAPLSSLNALSANHAAPRAAAPSANRSA